MPRIGDPQDGTPRAPRTRRLTRRTAALVLLAAVLTGAAYGAISLARMAGFLRRAHVGTLPLVEVPARRGAPGDMMVVLLSADGGWARLDEELAARLSAAGYPVVGWNSLRYYMTPRDPEIAADDLSVVMRTYQRKWHRPRVLLVGYSFGADVLPVVATRLDGVDRASIAGMVLLGFSADAQFKFRPRELGGRVRDYPTLPAVHQLVDLPILCIGGDRDRRSACARIGTPNASSRTIASGHSLGAHADQVFELLLPMLRRLEAKAPASPSADSP